MKRENQVFQGELKDKELYLLEDALEYYADGHKEEKQRSDELILKLYQFREFKMK